MANTRSITGGTDVTGAFTTPALTLAFQVSAAWSGVGTLSGDINFPPQAWAGSAAWSGTTSFAANLIKLVFEWQASTAWTGIGSWSGNLTPPTTEWQALAAWSGSAQWGNPLPLSLLFHFDVTPPTVPTLVQHVGSTVNDNNGITGNAFKFTPPNVVGAGNCLILGISYPYSAGRTVSVTDSSGDTWPAAAITTTDSSNLAQKIFVLPNASAALHTITVTFDTALKPFGYSVSEFYNIDTTSPVNGTHGTAASASPNVAAGSYTPTTDNDASGGHLIWTICRSNDKIGTYAVNTASNIAPTGGAALLDADNSSTIPGTSSYYVQSTRAAINPGFTVTQTTGTDFVCSSVALKAAKAGTPPPAGIRIIRILHTTATIATGDNVFHFPCDGNLLVIGQSNSASDTTYDTVTDNHSQSYTPNIADAGLPQVYYKQNATSANDLKLTFHATSVANTNQSMRLFDITGAAASAYDNKQGIDGSAPGSGTVINNWPDLTPVQAPGLTIAIGGFGTGPATSMAAGAPAGAVFDLVYYTGETDQDRMDNADMLGHVYYSTTATQNWNWTITAVTHGSTAYTTAVSFRAA